MHCCRTLTLASASFIVIIVGELGLVICEEMKRMSCKASGIIVKLSECNVS